MEGVNPWSFLITQFALHDDIWKAISPRVKNLDDVRRVGDHKWRDLKYEAMQEGFEEHEWY